MIDKSFLNEVINEIPGVSIDDIKVVLDAIKVELTDKDSIIAVFTAWDLDYQIRKLLKLC